MLINQMAISDQIVLAIISQQQGKLLKHHDIADEIGCDRKTVLRAIKRLKLNNKICAAGGRGRNGGYIYEVINELPRA